MISLKHQFPPKFHYMLIILSIPESLHHLMIKVYSQKTLINCATGVMHSGLSFIPSKSHIIHFSRNTTTPHNYLMNGVQLVVQDQRKDLGVMFTYNLYWG